MPVLDTNFLIRLDHGDKAAQAALAQIESEDLIVPAQAATEFLVRAPRPDLGLARLRAAFRIVHTSDDHVLAAAKLAARAFDERREPRPRWADIAIAAAAIVEETYVVTTNKRDFAPLGVEAWHYLEEKAPPAPRR